MQGMSKSSPVIAAYTGTFDPVINCDHSGEPGLIVTLTRLASTSCD